MWGRNLSPPVSLAPEEGGDKPRPYINIKITGRLWVFSTGALRKQALGQVLHSLSLLLVLQVVMAQEV